MATLLNLAVSILRLTGPPTSPPDYVTTHADSNDHSTRS